MMDNPLADKQGNIAAPSLDILVKANHILSHHKVVDGFGHVSLRCPDDPNTFWLSINRAPALVKAGDIIRHNLKGDPVKATDRAVYLERYIHAAVYSHRPDVMAIVHSHSHAIVPFSISKNTPLQPVWHMAGFLGEAVPIFDTADKFGNATDLLITNMDMANAMAETLAHHNVVLMRGHGATVVGRDLPEAVYRAVYSELNARIQMQASTLGDINYMSKAEGDATVERISPQIKRAWDLWCKEIDNLKLT